MLLKLLLQAEHWKAWMNCMKFAKKYPKERIVISVDVKDDELYSKNLDLTLKEFKDILIDIDVSQIILLDISGVGTKGI